MGGFVGEAVYFVFDGGAVARTDAFDGAVEHGGTVEVFADDAVGFGIGVDEVAGHLAAPGHAYS